MFKCIAIAVVAGATLAGCSLNNQQWHKDCTITAKDTLYSSQDGNTNRTYRLSTSCGTFDVEDSIAGGFNSWDRWQTLQVGQVYDLKTGGFRFGLASMFPTLLEANLKS